MEHQNQTGEIKRALQEKVLLDDGRQGFVFSELVQIGPSNRWHCHVCTKTLDSERALVMHLSHPLHAIKLRVCKHPAKNFKAFAVNDSGSTTKDRSPMKSDGTSWDVSTDILPGEPVPPGMEDVVEGVCQIQSAFDKHPGPLIGLEYIVELVTSEEEREPRYICLLCEKKGDPRSLMVHVTSQNHCLKYISCFFRTAGNALNMIQRTSENRKGIGLAIMKIADEIEKNYGRLKPTSAVAETFAVKKYEILGQIDEKEHFRETPCTTFAWFVTPEKIRELSKEDEAETPSVSEQKSKTLPSISRSKANEQIIKIQKPLHLPTKSEKGKEGKSDLEKNSFAKVEEENDPIEVSSSISSVSWSGDSDNEKRGNSPRSSSSRDRYYKKRKVTPEYDHGHHKFVYRSSRREKSPPTLRHARRSRSRSRERRSPLYSDYYRERDRTRRSPSYGYSKTGKHRYEDRFEGRYRHKSPIDRYDRDRKRRSSIERSERSLERRGRSIEKKKEGENRWDKYRSELHKLELTFDNKLKYFEERPEKHPKYSEEWKGFWNKRYKEIQLSGKDPTTYDFKPEWIVYWAKRMKDLNDEDFNRERDALKKKMSVDEKSERLSNSGLQDISPPTPESHKDVTVDDIKNTWKALTGTEITAPANSGEKSQNKRSPSPWEGGPTTSVNTSSERSTIKGSRKPYDIAPPVLHCLRMLSVLEHQLGSLGPRVMELLGNALVLERSKYNSSMTLLKDVDIHIFFETVKEKIRGQLIAGIVSRNLVPSSRALIKAIEAMLDSNPPTSNNRVNVEAKTPHSVLPTCEPVQVPGIGMIDKMAVAQQIANSLIIQGRTDVTQEELEDLINAVVGIAKASNTSVNRNLSSAAFFSQLNIENSKANSHINEILSTMISSAQKSLGTESKLPEKPVEKVPLSVQGSEQGAVLPNSVLNLLQTTAQQNKTNVLPTPNDPPVMLQPSVQTISGTTTKSVSDDELKEKLIKFSSLSRDEQQNLIFLLKDMEKTQISRVENLRKYVSIGLVQKFNHDNKGRCKDGRLSPFSSRVGGANPTPDDSQKIRQKEQMTTNKENEDDDDDDDDYSVEDVYRAASEKLFKKISNAKVNTDSEGVNKNDNSTSSSSLAVPHSDAHATTPTSTNQSVPPPPLENINSLFSILSGSAVQSSEENESRIPALGTVYQSNPSTVGSQNKFNNNTDNNTYYMDSGQTKTQQEFPVNYNRPGYPLGMTSSSSQLRNDEFNNGSDNPPFNNLQPMSNRNEPPNFYRNDQNNDKNYIGFRNF